MAVWFSPNHGTEFSDIWIVLRIVQNWVLRVGIQAGWKMHSRFCCELFFRIVFGLSVRTALWLNL